MAGTAGRLYVGTSGFSYPAWVPRFYLPGPASRKLLVAYSARLPAVELNNTFYRRPPPEQVSKWLRETPDTFRFCPKAQRSTAWRAWSSDDPSQSFAWLLDSFAGFGDRLGCVLLSARGSFQRDDEALARVLAAWPPSLPLAVELPHPSWHDETVGERIGQAGAAFVTTEWDDQPVHELGAFGAFLYLRLRRTRYEPLDLDRWARRLEPVLARGIDAFVFFRHDDDGGMALNAEALRARLAGHGAVTTTA